MLIKHIVSSNECFSDSAQPNGSIAGGNHLRGIREIRLRQIGRHRSARRGIRPRASFLAAKAFRPVLPAAKAAEAICAEAVFTETIVKSAERV